MRSHLLLTGALSIGSLASMGCSGVVESTPAEATSSTATAVVVVERTSGPGEAVRGDAVIARFVRVHQGTVDDQALRIAGAASTNRDLPAIGTCSTTQRAEAALQPRSVDLLDVGVLTLVSPPPMAGDQQTKNTMLVPRTMPDPTGVVSGVFYSARSSEAFTPSSRLQLHTSGGPDLPDGFNINVASPRDVADVRVTSPDRSANLDVAWEASESDDARDLVYVDVLSANTHDRRLVARCTTLDVGHLVVPSSALGALEDGQLSVHRLHREAFHAKGIEPGEIRFDLARVVAFHR